MVVVGMAVSPPSSAVAGTLHSTICIVHPFLIRAKQKRAAGACPATGQRVYVLSFPATSSGPLPLCMAGPTVGGPSLEAPEDACHVASLLTPLISASGLRTFVLGTPRKSAAVWPGVAITSMLCRVGFLEESLRHWQLAGWRT